MRYRGLIFTSFAALFGIAALACRPAQAVELAPKMMAPPQQSSLLQHAFFGHFRHTESYYCYPKNLWWFYRPYTTAANEDARCMPYFHFPPSAAGSRYESREMK